MSRSGYSEDYDDSGRLNLYRGTVDRATYGKRGQTFFRDLVAALDALPQKRLIAEELVRGVEVCALGSVGLKRGIEMEHLDPEDADRLGGLFNIAQCLVREVEYMNDEGNWNGETPEQRWVRMRKWAASNLLPAGTPSPEAPSDG